MTTMNELHNDGSDHKACNACGFCLDCGDCLCRLKGAAEELSPGEQEKRKQELDAMSPKERQKHLKETFGLEEDN